MNQLCYKWAQPPMEVEDVLAADQCIFNNYYINKIRAAHLMYFAAFSWMLLTNDAFLY